MQPRTIPPVGGRVQLQLGLVLTQWLYLGLRMHSPPNRHGVEPSGCTSVVTTQEQRVRVRRRHRVTTRVVATRGCTSHHGVEPSGCTSHHGCDTWITTGSRPSWSLRHVTFPPFCTTTDTCILTVWILTHPPVCQRESLPGFEPC